MASNRHSRRRGGRILMLLVVAVIAAMNNDMQRSFTNWIVRGVISGFVVGAITAYADYRRRKKELLEPLPNEEL